MKRVVSQIITLCLVFPCTLGLSTLQAQDRPSEKEVQVQKVFIEANKEKVLGNLEDAEYLFGEVIKKDKTNHAAHYELARLYITMNKLDKSKKSVEDALSMAPDNIWYNTLYADLLVEMEKYKEAAAIFDHLSEVAPDEIGFQFERALLYAESGNPELSIKAYNEIEKKMGVNPETSTQKHALYLLLKKPTKAAQELEKLITAFPKKVDYRLMLAEHHENTGEDEKAKAIYKEILKSSPDNPVANLAMAEEYRDQGQDAKYLRALQSIFSNPEVNIDVKIQEIVPYISLVGESKDEELAKEAIQLTSLLTITHPEEAKAFAVHGDMLNHADKPEEALPQYKKAVELNSGVFTVWEQILHLNSSLGKTDELLKISEEVMDLFPNQPTAYFFNGIANGQKKNHEEAVDALKQALIMSGKNTAMKEQIFIQLGSQYHYMGNHNKSDEAYESALEINAQNPSSLNNYSYYLAERGLQLEKAEEMAKRANELVPNSPSYLDTYGWVLYQRKKYREAQKWIGKALQMGGESSAEILENYGDVLYQLNEIDEAVKYWQKAQAKNPTSEELNKKITTKKIQ